MGSAQVRWRDVEKMLEACAPGWKMEMKTHSRVVYANGNVYPTLTKRDPIEAGYLKKMCRVLGILDCAKKHIQSLAQ